MHRSQRESSGWPVIGLLPCTLLSLTAAWERGGLMLAKGSLAHPPVPILHSRAASFRILPYVLECSVPVVVGRLQVQGLLIARPW